MTLVIDDTRETLGMSSQGVSKYVRAITGTPLRLGNYEVQAETLRDSPLFLILRFTLG